MSLKSCGLYNVLLDPVPVVWDIPAVVICGVFFLPLLEPRYVVLSVRSVSARSVFFCFLPLSFSITRCDTPPPPPLNGNLDAVVDVDWRRRILILGFSYRVG